MQIANSPTNNRHDLRSWIELLVLHMYTCRYGTCSCGDEPITYSWQCSVFPKKVKLIRRLQYSPSNRRHEAAHDTFGIVTAIEYDSRCAHMYDLYGTD